jgi:YD repeat-containing protein
VNGQLRGKVKGSNTVTATSASTYTDGAWHQGVFTRAGSNFTLYVDGAQVATASGSAGGLDTSGASTVVGASVSGSNRFSGVLDEIAAYASALSSARVLAHYNARNAPCANVGTNSSSYTLGSADVGSSALVGVTASNSAGSAAASSLPLLVAAKTKPASVNPPTIGGNSPVVGQVVTADPGSWDQAASYTYQWRRCTPYANVVAQDSPVDEWRLGERDTSKIIAADSVGTSKGAYQGGPLYGYSGALAQDTDSAVYFDGDSSQSVSVAQAPAFGSGPFTVEAWFRSTKTSGQYQIWYSGKTGSVQIVLLDGKLQASASDGTNGVTLTSSTAVYADGAWHQVAFTRSGTSFLLYADGAQIASGTKAMNAVGDPDAVADIGAKEGGTNYFTGAIDEVAVYTSALSSTRIGAHRSSALDPCINLSGQVTSTYTVASADAGFYLSVRVGATNSAGTGYADAPLTLAAPVGSPINTAAPKITGTVAIGQTLAASTGSWTGSGSITYGYQWQRCDGYAPTVSADSPLRWYRLDDMGTSSAADETGNSTAGSYSGLPRFGIAGALAYEPSTGVTLNVSDDANPPPPDQAATLPTVQLNSGDFTVEGWFKRADSSGATQRIWMSGSGQTLSRFVTLYVSNGIIKSKATDGTSSIDLSGTKIPTDDDWHHAAFTRSGSTFTLYLDGLQVATGTQTLGDVDSDAQPAYIGRSADGTQYFVGSLDEIAVYTSALNATRIQARVKNAYLNCSDIAGATSQTYPVASADRNRRLNVKVTATNTSGSTSKLSDQTDSLHDPKLTLDIPVDGGIARSLTPTLKVNALSGSGPYDYAIELSDSDTFVKTVAASGWQTSTTTWTVPSGAELKDGKSYYWRARARYTGATTLWSKPRSLQIKVKRLGLNDAWPMWKAGPLAVNEATGNLVLSLPGPSYASVADGFSVGATYNSLDSTDNGLGAGWTLDAGRGAPVKLWDHAHANDPQDQFDSAEVIWPDGSSNFFSHVGNANSRVYKAPTGSSMYLSKNGDGSWTLNDNAGSVYSFGAASGGGIAKLLSAEITAGAPGKAKLTYTYNDSPLRLTQITDPAGRTLTLTWNALTPGSCAGALLCVTGPDNVTWKYIGDGTGGTSGRIAKVNDGTRDLLQITYTNGKPTQIQNANDLNPSQASPGYNSAHTVTIAYTNNLATQIAEGPITGQTPSTSTWSFAYQSGPAATSATAAGHGELAAGTVRNADGYTEITPPREQGTQNKTTVYYDDLDHPIDTLDLLGHHTRSSYTRSDQLEWTEDPDGNPTDYSYDPVTNALLAKSNPNPAGGSPLTTSYRYDELTIGTAQAPGPSLQGLHAAYFANATLSGRPAVDQTDPQVDFNWGNSGPPALGGRSDNYSVRWTGILTIPAGAEGDYTFSTPLRRQHQPRHRPNRSHRRRRPIHGHQRPPRTHPHLRLLPAGPPQARQAHAHP